MNIKVFVRLVKSKRDVVVDNDGVLGEVYYGEYDDIVG